MTPVYRAARVQRGAPESRRAEVLDSHDRGRNHWPATPRRGERRSWSPTGRAADRFLAGSALVLVGAFAATVVVGVGVDPAPVLFVEAAAAAVLAAGLALSGVRVNARGGRSGRRHRCSGEAGRWVT